MNVIGTQAIWHHAPAPARLTAVAAAPLGGAGGHNLGEIILAILVLVGLGFGVTRLRRGRPRAQHDEKWVRRQPPPAPPSQAPPSEPPGGTTISPARTPRAAVS